MDHKDSLEVLINKVDLFLEAMASTKKEKRELLRRSSAVLNKED